MADYDSSSLWTDWPEHGMIPLESLDLEGQTKKALEAWSNGLWALSEAEDGAPTDSTARNSFDAEGRRLWLEVRTQLGPDIEVGFALFDAAPDSSGSSKRIIWDPAAVR